LEADPLANPEDVLQQLRAFRTAYPEVPVEGDLKALAERINARHQEQLEAHARLAYDELLAAENQNEDPLTLLSRADRHLRDFAGTSYEEKFRDRLHALLARMDGRDIESARSYSKKSPFNFQTRKEMFQAYLDKHPMGVYASEARDAIAKIEDEWDRYDFRQI